MEHREDAILCQHLLRTGAVAVGDLVACAEAQRAARRSGSAIPRLDELLLQKGLLDVARLEQVRAAALGQTAPRRRRAGSSSGRLAARPEGVTPADDREADGVIPGDRLGSFVIEARVAQGSMGAVFAARCSRTGERVALKVLAGERARRDAGARRFVQEAQLACSLRHDAVVRGLTFGVDAGRRYFVMELVQGKNLKNMLRERGALPDVEVAALGAQVARALAYLHAEGVIHRDVKPANILVGDGGRVKLCDLGLAREVDVPSEATASGDTIGTPRYMAPEQARGQKDVGPAADLYSLGVTLFHVATGRPPFPEESGVVVLSRHLFDQVPDPRTVRPGLPADLADVIVALTRKEPGQRPAAAIDVAIALESIVERGPAQRAAA